MGAEAVPKDGRILGVDSDPTVRPTMGEFSLV